MTTFKVYLTKEQWERACKADKEIALEVGKQQPALAAEIGFEVRQVEEIVAKEQTSGDKPNETPKPPRKK